MTSMLVESDDEYGSPVPMLSVVSACYDVGAYVDEFARSLEQQLVSADQLEVIAVDDGSTDDSLDRIKACAHRSRYRWRVMSQENAGQGAARNLGLERAEGQWVTFVDPDDWLDDHYLDAIVTFMTEFPDAELVAGARVPMREQADQLRRYSHPLDRMFTSDVLVDLDKFPEYFHGSAPAAFMRTERLRSESLRFDAAIRPNFEDANFIARYLLTCAVPQVGFVGSARYYYRKRSDGSSSTQRGAAERDRFAVVPQRGVRDLLQLAKRLKGSVPYWLQNLVLYELSYYFSDDEERAGDPNYACAGAVAAEFVDTLGEIASLLSPDMIRGFRVRHFDPAWRDILLHSFGREPWNTPYAVVSVEPSGTASVAIRYTGPAPNAVVLADGCPVQSAATYLDIERFGRSLLSEYSVDVPGDSEIRVLVRGAHLPLRGCWEPQAVNAITPSDARGRRLPVRSAAAPSGVRRADSLRALRRRRFRMDFGWRARRKIRHVMTMLPGR